MRGKKVLLVGIGAVVVGFGAAWALTSAFLPAEADKQTVAPTRKPVPSPSPSSGIKFTLVSPKPSDAPLPAGQSRVNISLFGVKMVVADPIDDLVYGTLGDSSRKMVGFTTQALLAQYPLCKPGALGYLSRKQHIGPTGSPSASPTPSYTPRYTSSPNPLGKNGLVKTIGNFDYYYLSPSYSQLSCANDQFGRNSIAAAKAAVLNAALPTLAQ
jgi:hypothetical protein